MKEKDILILEYFEDIYPSSEPPAVVYFNLLFRGDEFDLDDRTGEFSKSTLRNRIRILEDNRLVEVTREKGNYRRISEKGRAFLSGDLDPTDLND